MKKFIITNFLLIAFLPILQAEGISSKVRKIFGQTNIEIIQQAKQITIYRIHRGKKHKGKHYIQGYPIINQTVIDGYSKVAKQIKQILLNEKLYKIKKKKVCFYPHHAIKIQNEYKTITLLVCFLCKKFKGTVSADIGNYQETLQDALQEALKATPQQIPALAKQLKQKEDCLQYHAILSLSTIKKEAEKVITLIFQENKNLIFFSRVIANYAFEYMGDTAVPILLAKIKGSQQNSKINFFHWLAKAIKRSKNKKTVVIFLKKLLQKEKNKKTRKEIEKVLLQIKKD